MGDLNAVRPIFRSITRRCCKLPAAQAIAVRDERGEANTEELRKAVVYYRALFDECLR